MKKQHTILSEYYFTCGQAHRHIVNNSLWDKDSVLVVRAQNEAMARAKVFLFAENKWSGCYGPDDIDMRFYKNGICAVITA